MMSDCSDIEECHVCGIEGDDEDSWLCDECLEPTCSKCIEGMVKEGDTRIVCVDCLQ